jgi:ketol-acid reductoisomerase
VGKAYNLDMVFQASYQYHFTDWISAGLEIGYGGVAFKTGLTKGIEEEGRRTEDPNTYRVARSGIGLLALAKAAGALKAGAVEVSFEQEAELDLFAQQVLMPVMQHVIQKAAQLLMSRGYPPEAVLTELYLSGEFADYLRQAARVGLLPALQSASLTSQYSTFSRLDRFNDLKLERLMEVTLDEIHTGRFAQEWGKEAADGYRRLNSLVKSQENQELFELEQQTLDLFGRSDDSGG